MKFYFKLSFKNLILFAYIWLGLGFSMGLITLLGPVRIIADYSRSHHYSDGTENVLVKVSIAFLILSSFIISSFLTGKTIKAPTLKKKMVIPILTSVLGLASLCLLVNPRVLKSFSNEKIDTENARFAFGSYPSADDLKRLKKEGYQNVISLLHPSVTPFEPILLKEEKELCNKLGINLISVPMLPWVSQNAEAINRIKEIAANPAGKYYIHCYLGKDRVNMVKRIISNYNENIKLSTDDVSATRLLDTIKNFERGPIIKIKDGVFFTPYPTDEEYMGNIIAAGVQKVISLMDSTVAEQKVRIDEERKLLATYNIPFVVTTISGQEKNKQLEKLKEEVELAPKPLIIHNFFSNGTEDLKAVEFLKASIGK